jgi:hypothetical protein
MDKRAAELITGRMAQAQQEAKKDDPSSPLSGMKEIRAEGSKMKSFTQDELTAIWEKRAERDEDDGSWNVNGLVAQWVSEEEGYQTFTLRTASAPTRYNDHRIDNAPVAYTRWRANKEAPWDRWGS